MMDFFLEIYIFITEVQLIYNTILISGIQYSDSIFYNYTPFKPIIKYSQYFI